VPYFSAKSPQAGANVIVKHAHCRSHKKLMLEELGAALRREGFNAVFATARHMVAEELGPLGVVVPGTFDRSSEAFVSTDREQAILTRAEELRTSDGGGNYLFDFVVLSKTRPLESLLESLGKATNLELVHHSRKEETLIEAIRGRISNVSPNGKLLDEQRIRDAASTLENDRVREQLREISSTVGAISLPRPELEKLPTLSESGDIDRLITLGALTSNFQIQCEGCQTAHLVFARSEEAEGGLDSAKCPCGKSKLRVVETYGVEFSHQQALQQGVWLEADCGVPNQPSVGWSNTRNRRNRCA
jgi:hypothetical protein